MTRVVIVHRDRQVADRMAAELRGIGYQTEQCGGPQQEPCPVMEDLPCPLVDRADVLVYDARVAGDSEGGHRLVSHLRDVYADLPVVLITGFATAFQSKQWKRLGLEGFLTKPFRIDEMLDMVASLAPDATRTPGKTLANT